MSKSPTQRTMETLRRYGYHCGVVERWIAQAGLHGKRIDLFGIFDIISMSHPHIIGIQCCAGSGLSAHKKKILDSNIAPIWLGCNGKIQIWAWRKIKVKRGGKAIKWEPNVVEITEEDFK